MLRATRWAYTTVQTLLTRLMAKGYVAADRSGPAHVYRPAVSRGELLQQRLTDLADTFCEGTASPLMLALVEGSSSRRKKSPSSANCSTSSRPSSPGRKKKGGKP